MDYYGGVLGFKWRKAYGVKGRTRDDAIVFTTSLCLRYGYGIGQLMGYVNDLTGSGSVADPMQERDYNAHEVALYIGSSLYF